jgi:DNA ligase (NAD+)
MKSTVRERHQKLKKDISEHDYRYYGLDQPLISDFEYDQLFAELLKLEAENPDLDVADSPSQKVSGVVIDAFQKVPHRKPMLSLSNTYSAEDLHDFNDKITKHLAAQEKFEFTVEPKFDGLALELIYENGLLVRALTRGDGQVGEDVTHSARTIKNIPLRLNQKTLAAPKLLEVRGEVIIFKKDFLEMNERLTDLGQEVFANPRNAAAGTLRQLDGKVAAQRPLRFFAYALGEIEGIEFKTQSQMLEDFIHWGLPVVTSQYRRVVQGVESVIAFYHELELLRKSLPFEIDGMVTKVNSFYLQNELGFVARTPRWATASKYAPEQVQTVVEDIALQVGRTGAVTPVAKLRPASVGGVVVSNATLHNFEELRRKDVRIHDSVFIQRAGDVIPEVVSVIFEKRPQDSRPFPVPTQCPECGSELITQPDEVVIRCPNTGCPAVLRENLKHFVSRRAMNIEKIGDRLVEELLQKGVVKYFPDFYKLSKEDLLALDRKGEKSAQNILTSLEKSKDTTLERLIFAIGIRFVGEQTAKALASHYLNLEGFLKATEESLVSIPDVGPRVAQSISLWLGQKANQKRLQELPGLGLKIATQGRSQTGPLVGLSFLITGTLPISRDQAKEKIESLGGKILSSVSAKLNYLVVGEDPGSKLQKAQSLKVEILDWAGFENLVKEKS